MFKKPITWIILLLTTMLVYVFYPADSDNKRFRRGGVTTVDIQPVTSQMLKDQLVSLGTAQANESVEITAQSTDRVDTIHFASGDNVAKGQLLVSLVQKEEQALVKELTITVAENKRQLKRLLELEKQSASAQSAIDVQTALVKTSQAKLSVAKIRLAEKQIHAPFSGVLGLREISPGQLVTNSTVLTTLDDVAKIKVEFELPEKYLTKIKLGQSVAATNVAYETPFVGSVLEIASRIDKKTRSFRVRALFNNELGKLRPGMLLQVAVETRAQQALTIPESAIIPQNDHHYVYLVVDSTVKKQQVTIGRRKPGVVEVVSGLTEGQQVVSKGVIKVRPGSKVQASQNNS